MKLGLIGNQNCGKTTLFNQLTGSNQHVGNFPGVTVERKIGRIKKRKDISVVDLPGIYSLSPYTSEEVVTRDFLINERPDAIINIVDATNIERNLYLTLQVIDLSIPMVLALNMMDEVRSSGTGIDISLLSELLGIPVIPVSASRNEGVSELIDRVIDVAESKRVPKKTDFCSNEVHRALHSIIHLIEDHADEIKVPRRFAAAKLVEGDEPMQNALKLSTNEIETIEHIVSEMETSLGTDREAAMADMRYQYIEAVCSIAVTKSSGISKEKSSSEKADRLLTHKFFAIPVFLLIMVLIFFMTFEVIGPFLSDLLAVIIDELTIAADYLMTSLNINPVIHSLLIDGVFAGVGSVLSFLPIIVVLFFFLSILEDSGYMARVAFVMDKLLRKIGLSGRSIVPMLIGFGCTVPAVLSTRTLSSERDRKMTILLTPFMSCSAKVPIYAVFTAAFFPKNGALVMICLYLFGILLAILSGLLMKKTLFRGKPVPFVMELPNYRFPSPKSVIMLMWEKARDFLIRAFTIIFVATIIIWFLQSFDSQLNIVDDAGNSILASIGRLLAPVFSPLGFGDWRAVTALITGFSAKEAVVSTLAVLTGSTAETLSDILPALFSTTGAVSFLVFTLLYTPCIAAVSAFKRELKNVRSALLMVIYQTGIAWLAAFVVYNTGKLIIG